MQGRLLVRASTSSMSAAPPVFSILSKDGKSRLGQLKTKQGHVVDTPAALIYTRRGGTVSMTPDLLASLKPPAQGVQISAMHFLEHPSPDVLEAYGKGGHEFLALQPYVLLAGARDPCCWEYGAKPSSNEAAYLTIHSGGCMVTPQRYMAAVRALQPDLYVTLCDEHTADAGGKRVAAALTRNQKWLTACLEEAAKPSPSGAQPLEGAGALAAVGGGALATERARAAKEVADKDVAGFALCGFGCGEAPGKRAELMAAALEQLPGGKPVYVPGMLTPLEILDAVAEGVDLFDGAYVQQLCAGGYAACFPLDPRSATPDSDPDPAGGEGSVKQADADATSQAAAVAVGGGRSAFGAQEASVSGSDLGSDATKINLWSVAYRLDKGPLVPGCSCFTCRNHSRGYVHHLLQAQEMLAEVLLEVHNTHHVLSFFQAVRSAVASGTLQQYRDAFHALSSGFARKAVASPSRRAGRGSKRGVGDGDDDTGIVMDGAPDSRGRQHAKKQREQSPQAQASGAAGAGGWVRVERRQQQQHQ